MSRFAVRTAVHAGALLAVTGAVAWLTGTPFVFPSLGPTAYVLATRRTADRSELARVVAAHVVGVAAGLFSYRLLADGVVVTADLAPRSPALAAVVASGVLALALTSAGMVATGAIHPPACATTLIVSLGLLPTLREGLLIAVAVCVLVAAHAVAVRALSVSDERERSVPDAS
ncbi:HPP family protein [Halosimplex pelagicum]|uniref:HPP family protein n=1 Tax=Halosimplex pelagicum TaxID=869886 RepID=A0A7D5PED8_9EURY|nr:HPP family protein [Halosimplex pelagicum]QLH81439.1 HPP family protein [Halosimplex pelagicum]